MSIITNPQEWKQHTNLEIILVDNIKSVNISVLKNVKKLILKIKGERLRYASESDPIWIARKKSNKKKILGICMLSKYSPDSHFDSEDKNVNIPYLYNMITDITNKKIKILKVSVSLLMRLKIDLMINENIWKWLNPNMPHKPTSLNLDVSIEDEHAKNFYIKNKFDGHKIYSICNMNKSIKYNMLTCNL